MKKLISISALVIGAFFVMVMAGGNVPEGMAGPKEGSPCKNLGPMEGRVACDGKKVIACSSYTKYKYIVTQTCTAAQKCVAAPDGQSASCK